MNSTYTRLHYKGIREIALEENCPLVKARVWVRVIFRFRWQFSSGTIVLEPIIKFQKPATSIYVKHKAKIIITFFTGGGNARS